MPKPIGDILNITNGQRQREVSRFQVEVTYNESGAPTFYFEGFGVQRLRDNAGAIIWEGQQKEIVAVPDSNIPAAIHSAFVSIVNKLDTL